MTTRTREWKSPRMWAGALSVLAALGCAGGRLVGADATDATPQRDYFHREGNGFHGRLRAEANRSASVAPDLLVIGVLDYRTGDPEFNSLTYIPSELHVKSGIRTQITWVSWDGDFTLTYLPDTTDPKPSPLEGGKKEVVSSQSGVLSSVTETVNSNAPGRYHFKVNLKTPLREYNDPTCPPIIIQ